MRLPHLGKLKIMFCEQAPHRLWIAGKRVMPKERPGRGESRIGFAAGGVPRVVCCVSPEQLLSEIRECDGKVCSRKYSKVESINQPHFRYYLLTERALDIGSAVYEYRSQLVYIVVGSNDCKNAE